MKNAFKPLLLVLLSVVGVFGFNHSEIKWKTVTTDHFIINFYDKTEPALHVAATIAEDAYTALANMYNYRPGYNLKNKIALSIAEYDDYANGFASWLDGSIMIWLPDSRWDLRGNTTWLKNVITHELTHIISLHQKRGLQLLDISLSFDISTPDEMYGIAEPFARTTIFPMWLVEGISQFETAQFEGDCFDARREMLLRDAVLSGNALTIEEMGHFNHDFYGNEMVYNQGFAFTSYLFGRIGSDKMHRLFMTGGKKKIDFNGTFFELTGKSITGYYRSWMDSLRNAYMRQRPGRTTEQSFIARNGKLNLLPKYSPDGMHMAWLSSNGDDGGRTDLMLRKKGESTPSVKIPWAHTSYCFSASSDNVYYLLSRTANRRGSYFNDVFSYTISTGKKQRVTTDGRVYEIAPLYGSRDLLVVSYRNGTYGLYRLKTATGMFSEIIAGEQGNPFLTVATHPDHPDSAVVSRLVGGTAQLFIVALNEKTLTRITDGGAQKESPFWGDDGRIYFSSDYSGIFNIFSMAGDGSDLRKHTSTAGGYFSPIANGDGTMTASHFSDGGFSIVSLSPDHEAYTAPESGRCSLHPLPVIRKKKKIHPVPYVSQLRRSVWEIGFKGSFDKNGSLFTHQYGSGFDTTQYLVGGVVEVSSSDALEKQMRKIQVAAGIAGLSTSNSDTRRVKLSGPEHEIREIPSTDGLLRQCFVSNEKQRCVPPKKKHYSLNMPLDVLPLMKLAQSGGTDDESSETSPAFIPVIQPMAAYENRFGAPTFGVQVGAQLVMVILPQVVSCTPYLSYQISREWSCGAQLELYLRPFHEVSSAYALPLYLSWHHIGYYNEDFEYNGAGFSQVEVAVGPQSLPGMTVSAYNDSTEQSISGMSASLGIFHAFPLRKYGSLQLYNASAASWHDSSTTDDLLFTDTQNAGSLLDGTSQVYFMNQSRINLVFPVNRTMNSGTVWYNDALYASVGYQLFLYGNGRFFTGFSEIDKERLFREPNAEENVFVEHGISLGLELGHYKSYLFTKRHSFSLTYYFLSESMRISLTSGF